MEDTQRIARISTILDEIKESAESLAQRTGYHVASEIHTKADEAQRLLMGDEPTDSRDN